MAGEIRTLIDDLFVPVEAEPVEPVEDRARGLIRAARLVRVLDAQEELAAVLAGVEPVEERGAGAADVEVTSGAGGESYPDRHSMRCGVRRREGGGRNSIRCGVRRRNAGGGARFGAGCGG